MSRHTGSLVVTTTSHHLPFGYACKRKILIMPQANRQRRKLLFGFVGEADGSVNGNRESFPNGVGLVGYHGLYRVPRVDAPICFDTTRGKIGFDPTRGWDEVSAVATERRLPWRSLLDMVRCWWQMGGWLTWVPFSSRDSIYSTTLRLHENGDVSGLSDGRWTRYQRSRPFRPTEVDVNGHHRFWRLVRNGDFVCLLQRGAPTLVAEFRFEDGRGWRRLVELTPVPMSTAHAWGIRFEEYGLIFPMMKPKPCFVSLGKSFLVYFSKSEYVYVSDANPNWVILSGKRSREFYFDGVMWWANGRFKTTVNGHPIPFSEFQASHSVSPEILLFPNGHVQIGSTDYAPTASIRICSGGTLIERASDGWIFVLDKQGNVQGGQFDGQIWRWGGRTRTRALDGFSLRDCFAADPVFQPFLWVFRSFLRLIPPCVPSVVSAVLAAVCSSFRIATGVASLVAGICLLLVILLSFLEGLFG